MEFSRQECWSGLPFPTPDNLPNPGTELTSFASPALAGGFFNTAPLGGPLNHGGGSDFCLIQDFNRLNETHRLGEGNLLYSVYIFRW